MNFETYTLNDSRVSKALILTPNDLRSIAKGCGLSDAQAQRLSAGCGLYSETSQQVYSKLIAPDCLEAGFRMLAIEGPAGGSYVIVVYQIGEHQHRFLLPIYEPSVKKLLSTLHQGPLTTLVGIKGTPDLARLRNEIQQDNAVPLQVLSQLDPVCPPEDARNETLLALQALSYREAVPGLLGRSVETIHIGVLMPSEYCAQVDVDETAQVLQ